MANIGFYLPRLRQESGGLRADDVSGAGGGTYRQVRCGRQRRGGHQHLRLYRLGEIRSHRLHFLQTAALKAEGLVGKILVTGCLSQRYQEDILKEMPEVDGILGTGSYTEIVPAIEKLLNGGAGGGLRLHRRPGSGNGTHHDHGGTLRLHQNRRGLRTTTAPTASFPPFGANTAAARWTTCFTKPECWRTAA